MKKAERRVRTKRRQDGFTIVELMVVISIILILVSVAIPIYNQSIVRAREAVLRQNLFTLRSCIDQYAMDKEKAPQSLDDLVQAGYLKQVPIDPFTNNRETWQAISEDVTISVNQDEPGISDVHSGAGGTGSDGTPYAEW